MRTLLLTIMPVAVLILLNSCISSSQDYYDLNHKKDPIIVEKRPVENSVELCLDGIDNDLDGVPDCKDTDCMVLAVCQEDNQETCTDGDDNDGDGVFDCADAGCKHLAVCQEITTANCSDGNDNDMDGDVDCEDTDCEFTTACTTSGENTSELCKDGVNNDAPTDDNNLWEDNLIDCEDSQCAEFLFCRYPPQDTMFVIAYKENNFPENYYKMSEQPYNSIWGCTHGGDHYCTEATVYNGCYEGSECMKIDLGGAWDMVYIRFREDPALNTIGFDDPNSITLDISGQWSNELVFMIKSEAASNLEMKYEYTGAADAVVINIDRYGYVASNPKWQEIRIPLNELTPKSKMEIVSIPFSLMSALTGGGERGPVWIDDIRYEAPVY